MTVLITWLARLAGLFGLNLSPFSRNAIVFGAIAVGVAAYSGYLVHAGYSYAESKCEAATLRKENAQLVAELAEKQRQIVLMTSIQERDAKRAADAETQLRANQEAIDATPANPGKCFDRAASGRVRNVR